jgi:hypothetical protein
MSWAARHREGEGLAAQAEAAVRGGDPSRAKSLYALAADAEEAALAALDRGKARTLGVSAVSAVSLRYKAGQYQLAEAAAYTWLASGSLPEFAVLQLKDLLEAIWIEAARERTGLSFAPGQVIVSVKGGEVVRGGAPLDLIVEKVQTVQSLFYRTAEFLRGLPHRTRGSPSPEIQEMFRPWLFQTPAGSYQFAVAVQEARQPDLFLKGGPTSADVADRFLNILRASAEDPEEELPHVVPNESYRATFLKLTRNLAPTGKTFDQLEIRASDEGRPITFMPTTRRAIGEAVRKTTRQRPDTAGLPEETLRGVLRAVHLDDDWLEVTVGDQAVKVVGVGEAVDDLIGPMVNRPVILRAALDTRGRRLFRDIEREE